ncbi:hypothetical protein BJY04DRAFT_220787 [Aspergillus karnatakaensis]|uniref:uncharacterized protein n=1 Tax=Aspergillus karnatakaensis TaxID=1810916 RepID=UPI003CCE02FA
MPSTTTLFGYTLTNWGPVSTSYSVPEASCTSSIALANSDHPRLPTWRNYCGTGIQPFCGPEPTDSSALESGIAANNDPGDGQLVAYYSPAPECPIGWVTVGVAERGEQGTLTKEGIYEATGLGGEAPPTPRPTFFNPRDAVAALLDPGETAVMCCPSGMSVLDHGLCGSTLSSFEVSTVCNTVIRNPAVGTFTTGIPGDDGQTPTGEILLYTASNDPTTESTTLEPSETALVIAYSLVEPIALLHRATDVSDSGEGSEDEEGDQGGNEEQENDEGNTASRNSLGGGSFWAQLSGGFVVLVVTGVVFGL